MTGYALDGRSIRCLHCGRTSYNPSDVRERYCGFCHRFHEDDAMTDKAEIHRLAQELARKLTDEGKLIKAGWVVFEGMVLPQSASQAQRDDMEIAFFAGAQHLFGTMISIMEEGEEPTEKDMNRMDQINAELNRFAELMKANMEAMRGTKQ